MSRVAGLLPFFAAAMVIETLAAGFFADAGGRPDLLLALLCIAALNLPQREAITAGLAAGFMHDAFSGGAFGTGAVVYTAAAVVASRMRTDTAHDTVAVQVLLAFTLAAFVGALAVARLAVLSATFDADAALGTIFRTALLTALAAPIIFQLKEPVFARLGLVEQAYAPVGAVR